MLEIDSLGIFSENIHPYVIAGPCSAESERQIMDTAERLAAIGTEVFRAGLWKPRTRPGCFEGVGESGLAWLREVKRRTGMKIATEVASARHVEQSLSAGVDLLWLGSRTTTNPFTVQEIADALRGCDVPVLVKNPINPDIELWIGAFQRLNMAGVTRIAAVHRGFSVYNSSVYRNAPQWHIPIEMRRRFPALPIFCDPSHMGGKRDLVFPISQQALDLRYDGLMIECHSNPSEALSDAHQQITPEELEDLLVRLVLNINDYDGSDGALFDLRRQIDALDTMLMETLARRMEIASRLGEYKSRHNMPVLQTDRYNEILRRLEERCASMNLDSDFMKRIFEIIHEQSVKEQLNRVYTQVDRKEKTD